MVRGESEVAAGLANFVAGLCVMAYLLSPSTPRLDRAEAYALAPTPIASQVMEVGPHESVVLTREGAVLRIHVVYDGIIRGQLMRLDTATRTLEAPSRPPAGFKIGGM